MFAGVPLVLYVWDRSPLSMKNEITYLHCGDYLKDTLKTEIAEVVHVVESIEWEEIFRVTTPSSTLLHQSAYNGS